jgi:tetraacyldisaccharide 4'-kinase
MHAPDFWYRNDIYAKLSKMALMPFGWLYSAVVASKAKRPGPHAPVPVVCVGNLTVGGTGKTPVAIAVANRLAMKGKRPFFLSRGYGGKLAGPILVTAEHRAADVGDEPLLLAEAGPTIVSRNRARGAALAVALGADVIVMDDGHQNFTIAKDVSLVVVDAAQMFGNGGVLPAGPLREFVRQGLSRADGVIVVGEDEVDLRGYGGPVLHARIVPAEMPQLKGAYVVAFAGIGRPKKFFASLKDSGAYVVSAKRFGDHHVYSSSEIARLRATAKERGALLVTTAKDYVRMTAIEREGVTVLPIEVKFDDPAALERLLDPLSRKE